MNTVGLESFLTWSTLPIGTLLPVAEGEPRAEALEPGLVFGRCPWRTGLARMFCGTQTYPL